MTLSGTPSSALRIGIAGSPKARAVAAASRRLESAVEFSNSLGIQHCFGSYETLLADGGIDAGKHVLCEKPLALGLDQAKDMFDAARQNRIMLREAFPCECQPHDHGQCRNTGVLGTHCPNG